MSSQQFQGDNIMAANGASRDGGKSKPSGFKKQGDGSWPTVQVKPGQFRKVQLDNIKQLSRDSMGGGVKLSKTKTVRPDRGQGQVDNLRDLGSSKVRSGDNPFKGGKGK